MNVKNMLKLCQYLNSFEEDEFDFSFELTTNPFGDIVVLDFYHELDGCKMRELGCSYNEERKEYIVED